MAKIKKSRKIKKRRKLHKAAMKSIRIYALGSRDNFRFWLDVKYEPNSDFSKEVRNMISAAKNDVRYTSEKAAAGLVEYSLEFEPIRWIKFANGLLISM